PAASGVAGTVLHVEAMDEVDDGCERPMLRASRAKLGYDRARVVWTRPRLAVVGWLGEHDKRSWKRNAVLCNAQTRAKCDRL
ncbi:MAG: hypothetical protein ACPIOQ_46925, partial [Promethearchaeia archaeon]